MMLPVTGKCGSPDCLSTWQMAEILTRRAMFCTVSAIASQHDLHVSCSPFRYVWPNTLQRNAVDKRQLHCTVQIQQLCDPRYTEMFALVVSPKRLPMDNNAKLHTGYVKINTYIPVKLKWGYEIRPMELSWAWCTKNLIGQSYMPNCPANGHSRPKHYFVYYWLVRKHCNQYKETSHAKATACPYADYPSRRTRWLRAG